LQLDPVVTRIETLHPLGKMYSGWMNDPWDYEMERNSWGNPWDEFRRLQRDMDRMWGEYPSEGNKQQQGRLTGPSSSGGGGAMIPATSQGDLSLWRPRCDVTETEKSWIVHMDLPGIPKENISIDVEDNKLKITGERRAHDKQEGENFRRVERHYGKFRRVFPLETGIDPALIKANFNNGVVSVEVPKIKPSESFKVTW